MPKFNKLARRSWASLCIAARYRQRSGDMARIFTPTTATLYFHTCSTVSCSALALPGFPTLFLQQQYLPLPRLRWPPQSLSVCILKWCIFLIHVQLVVATKRQSKTTSTYPASLSPHLSVCFSFLSIFHLEFSIAFPLARILCMRACLCVCVCLVCVATCAHFRRGHFFYCLYSNLVCCPM